MTPRFSTAALTFAFVALAAFAVFEVRDNQSLRAQLRTEQAAARRRMAGQRVGPPTPTPAARTTAVTPEWIPTSEIPALLDRIIHSGSYSRYGSPADVSGPLTRIAPADLPRAFELMAAYPPSAARNKIRSALLRRWAVVDPRAAWAEVSSLPAAERERARDNVADVWADTDPAAAARARPGNQSVWRKFAVASFDKAAAAAVAQESPVSRNVAITTVAAEWASKDPAAAWTWTTSLPPELQLLGLQQTIWPMADVNPAAVADYLARIQANPAITNPRVDNAHVDATSLAQWAQSATDKWATRDPQAAATWATSLPLSSDLRRQAEMGVVNGWSTNDPAGARRWIESLPPADRAWNAMEFAFAVAKDDPATAAAVATQDCDATSNASVLTFVAAQWLKSDPAAARAWLAQTTLPAATRADLHRRGFKDLPGYPPGSGGSSQ